MSLSIREQVQQVIIRIERAIDKPWAIPMLALVMAADAFILVVPTYGIVFSVALLRPKKWLSSSLWLAVGSAVGAMALSIAITYASPLFTERWFQDAFNSPEWHRTQKLISDYGFWGLGALSLSPIPQYLGVAVASLGKMSAWSIFFAILLARSLKFVFYSLLCAKLPSVVYRWGLTPRLSSPSQSPPDTTHFTRPEENLFTLAQRDSTTLLFGGLTFRHDQILKSCFEGLGYKVETLSEPDLHAYGLGREFGNHGQCNPMYFTVGNLIRYLKQLHSQGKTKNEIIEEYIFLTPGSCGPCRFGMYEAEYRLALENAGYKGFRVLVYQQEGKLKQSGKKVGLDIDACFFAALVNGLMLGDLMHDLHFQIRPYEIVRGETDRIMKICLDELCACLRLFHQKKLKGLSGVIRFIWPLPIEGALAAIQKHLDNIEIDPILVKPKVKTIGEIWAQVTEGPGNFSVHRFLEDEGAEAISEPIGNFILYLLYLEKKNLRVRLGSFSVSARIQIAVIGLLEKLLIYRWDRWRRLFQFHPQKLLNQDELAELARPFFNPCIEGGEGHVEVAKNIYYHQNQLSHMLISIKPFGCMPSTQSDAIQESVKRYFHGMIFQSLETSGEGEASALGRIQMALHQAKVKAFDEFSELLAASGLTVSSLKAIIAKYPEIQKPFGPLPPLANATSRAARVLLYLSSRENL